MKFCTFCNQDVAPYKELKPRQGVISICPLCTNVLQEPGVNKTSSGSSHAEVNASVHSKISSSHIHSLKVVAPAKNASAAYSFSKPGQIERALRKRLSEIQKQIRAIQVLEKEKQRIQLMLDALLVSETHRSTKKKSSAS